MYTSDEYTFLIPHQNCRAYFRPFIQPARGIDRKIDASVRPYAPERFVPVCSVNDGAFIRKI